jgi:hypothetical protein
MTTALSSTTAQIAEPQHCPRCHRAVESHNLLIRSLGNTGLPDHRRVTLFCPECRIGFALDQILRGIEWTSTGVARIVDRASVLKKLKQRHGNFTAE